MPARGGVPLVVATSIGTSLGGAAVDAQGIIYVVADGLVQEYEAPREQG